MNKTLYDSLMWEIQDNPAFRTLMLKTRLLSVRVSADVDSLSKDNISLDVALITSQEEMGKMK